VSVIPVYFERSRGKLRILKTNDEILIELVRSHAELYDLSHPKYMDTTYKERIWKEVGQEMKQEGNVRNIYFIKITEA
jgi:hypothetical protein